MLYAGCLGLNSRPGDGQVGRSYVYDLGAVEMDGRRDATDRRAAAATAATRKPIEAWFTPEHIWCATRVHGMRKLLDIGIACWFLLVLGWNLNNRFD